MSLGVDANNTAATITPVTPVNTTIHPAKVHPMEALKCERCDTVLLVLLGPPLPPKLD